MKMLMKVMLFPISLILTVLVWLCTILIKCAGVVMGLGALVLAGLSVALFVTGNPKNGFIMLLLAFLFSPYGLPMLAILLLAQVERLRLAIQAHM